MSLKKWSARSRTVPALLALALPATAGLIGATTAQAAVAPEAAAAVAQGSRPGFHVPFLCGLTWAGQTRTSHSPLNAIDFNHYGAGGSRDDLGRRVTASAAGRVVTVVTGLETSYGNHIVVDHGGGWSTLYAHLKDGSVRVREGQRVTRGQVIARVGASGLSSPDIAHLHYEQRQQGDDVRAVFYGDVPALYFGTRDYLTPQC
jgi:murein DD-endopeptidase MepM/ murein hydrolase activator NlpD